MSMIEYFNSIKVQHNNVLMLYSKDSRCNLSFCNSIIKNIHITDKYIIFTLIFTDWSGYLKNTKKNLKTLMGLAKKQCL